MLSFVVPPPHHSIFVLGWKQDTHHLWASVKELVFLGPVVKSSSFWQIHQIRTFFLFYSSPPAWLFLILIHFSHDVYNYLLQPSPKPHFKLSRYFWSDFRSIKVSAPHKAVLHVWHFLLVSSLNLRPVCWCKDSASFWKLFLLWQSWI